MKKSVLFCLLSIYIILLGVINSCRKDDGSPLNEKGKISIKLGIEIDIKDTGKNLKSTLQADSFKVIIYNTTGAVVLEFENAIDLPGEIELIPGEYYVVANSKNFMPAAFENPYYFGRSENFVLENEEHRMVNVNCELANCAVSVIYSENIQNDFSDYYAIVSIEGGALIFNSNEIRMGYFDLAPLSIEAVLEYSLTGGSTATKTLTGIIDNPQAKKHYEIHIDASLADGQAAVIIHLDESIDPEVIEITDDSVDIIPGPVGYGDLLITEIMYDPSAISDTEGEWFEIYNNSLSDIDINQLVIKRASDLHIINQEIVLSPGEYFVLARSENATTASKYVYGSDITLTNTGGELIIANFGTDGSNGSEIASVNYGDTGFPDPVGASINLDPSYFNVEQAKSGFSWCESTVAYDTGDLGTPGVENSSCD
jgi:hypothetical protein